MSPANLSLEEAVDLPYDSLCGDGGDDDDDDVDLLPYYS